MYLASEKINIFPSATRTYEQSFPAKLLTESSIARIINILTDTDGFVITQTLGANLEFEFNIAGYYFQVDKLSDLTGSFSSDSNIYATIFLDITSSQFVQIYVPSDETSGFQGVTFTNDGNVTTPTITGKTFQKYTLKVLEKVSGSWQIPENSKIRYATSTVGLSVIDGGVI